MLRKNKDLVSLLIDLQKDKEKFSNMYDETLELKLANRDIYIDNLTHFKSNKEKYFKILYDSVVKAYSYVKTLNNNCSYAKIISNNNSIFYSVLVGTSAVILKSFDVLPFMNYFEIGLITGLTYASSGVFSKLTGQKKDNEREKKLINTIKSILNNTKSNIYVDLSLSQMNRKYDASKIKSYVKSAKDELSSFFNEYIHSEINQRVPFKETESITYPLFNARFFSSSAHNSKYNPRNELFCDNKGEE